jgi:hypothetical protein
MVHERLGCNAQPLGLAVSDTDAFGRIDFVPIENQWLRVGHFDQTESPVADRGDRFARHVGKFAFEFTLGHGENLSRRMAGCAQRRLESEEH